MGGRDVELAGGAAGAVGARMTGAGFGGSAIATNAALADEARALLIESNSA